MNIIPVVILTKKTSHIIANFDERMALLAVIAGSPFLFSTSFLSVADGCTINMAAKNPKTRITAPIIRNDETRLPSVKFRTVGAIIFDITSAPKPNPITTIPVTKPCLSGNHFDADTTGVT